MLKQKIKAQKEDTTVHFPKYHFHHEKGRVHLHLPLWLMILLGIAVAALIGTSVTLSYKLINRVALEQVHASERLALIQPPTPKATTGASASTAKTPIARIDAYNTGLAQDAGLQKILDAYNAITPPTGIVVLDIADRTYASIEPDQARDVASLYKLFVARELYSLRKANKLSFDQTVTVTQTAASQDDNSPNLPVGTSIQISECLRRMIVISDNACGYLLGNLIGWNDINQTLHVRGYSQTSLGSEQLSSAGDIGLLLRRAAEGQMVDQASSQNLEAILFEQQINTGLPALLPPGVIGHKTGELDGGVHDAGIVRSGDKAYVIVVLSGPWKSVDEANNSIAGLSLQVYDYIMKIKT